MSSKTKYTQRYFGEVEERAHQIRSTGPDEDAEGVEVGHLGEDFDFLVPQPSHLVFEGRLPGILLQHLAE